MKTKIKSRHTVFFFVAASIFICGISQAQNWQAPGAQRAAVMGNWQPPAQGNNSGQIAAQQAAIAKQQAAAAAAAAAAVAAEKERKDEGRYLSEQGNDAYQRGDYETALKCFQYAFGKMPEDVNIAKFIQNALNVNGG
jgi:hypothetical protein